MSSLSSAGVRVAESKALLQLPQELKESEMLEPTDWRMISVWLGALKGRSQPIPEPQTSQRLRKQKGPLKM